MSKRLCNIHGLWTKTVEQPRCPKCRKTSNKTYSKHTRDSNSQSFYDSPAWRGVRGLVKRRDAGLCQQCMRDGFVTKSNVVDHIIEIEDGGCKLCKDNLECLCHACHNAKTARERNHRESK